MSTTLPIMNPIMQGIMQSLFGDPSPILHMPLVSDLVLLRGVGVATFTRSTTGTYVDKDDGLVKTAAIDAARFETNGVWIEGDSTNEALHNRDFTNAAHVKTNITALKDAKGADGVVSAASTLTATAANGTVFQTITKASAENTSSIDVRRKTGTGTVEISDDGGSTFTDITASINSTTYTRFEITTTQANPSIGLRIVTSGDEVEVDYEGLEVLPFASSRIPTVASTVTRTADNLSIDASNIPSPADDWSTTATIALLGNVDIQTIMNVPGEALRQFRAGQLEANNDGLLTSFYGSAGDRQITGANISTSTTNMALTVGTVGTTYIDGVQDDQSGSFTDPTGIKTAVEIGGRASTNDRHLFGHLKYFRIYDAELTPAQAAAL